MGEKQYQHVGVSAEEAVRLMREALECRENREGAPGRRENQEEAPGHRENQEGALEELPLEKAWGRITGCDSTSALDQPPFDRSPLDGYALRAEDTAGAGPDHPVKLVVNQEITAGEAPAKPIGPGQAARIMTGAPIPEGADCILRQEDTDYGEEIVTIYRELKAYDNYCHAGEDFRKGDCLLPAGTRLGAVELGILASMGAGRIKVRRRLRAAVFTTGDELTEPGKPLAPGKIYNSNLYMLRSRLEELGAEVAAAGVLPDTESGAAESLAEVLPRVDVILTTGGVSVGKKDILHGVLDRMGAEKIFWRVKVKPGTPTIFAMARGVPILALSGNPFGALTHLELLARPLLSMLSGDTSLEAPEARGILQNPFPKGSSMRRIVRGFFREGKVYLPQGLHSSGVLSSMQGCNCLIDIPAGSRGLAAGEEVSVILLRKKEEMPWWIHSGQESR